MTRRIVRLGDSSVAVDVSRSGDRVAERVADVVVPGCQAGDGNADVSFELASSGESVTLSRNGVCIVKNGSPGFVAHVLLDEIFPGALSSHCRQGVVLHAAAVALRGAAILIPGPSGAGKSTLAASLVRRGLTFIGDELIHLSNATVRSFPRPFAFKQAGASLLSRWVEMDDEDTLHTPIGVLVHSSLIGPSQLAACEVAAIVFPERSEDAAFALEPLTRAATALRLMASVVNGGNVQKHGFDDILHLSSLVSGHRLIYSDADEVTIEALVTSTSSSSRQSSVV